MKEQIDQLWALAEEQPHGLCIRTDSPAQLQEALIEARLAANRPGLYCFTIQVRGSEVLLIRSTATKSVKTDGEYKPLE